MTLPVSLGHLHKDLVCISAQGNANAVRHRANKLIAVLFCRCPFLFTNRGNVLRGYVFIKSRDGILRKLNANRVWGNDQRLWGIKIRTLSSPWFIGPGNIKITDRPFASTIEEKINVEGFGIGDEPHKNDEIGEEANE